MQHYLLWFGVLFTLLATGLLSHFVPAHIYTQTYNGTLAIILKNLHIFNVNIAYAIRCYSCESVYEANCGENFRMEPHFKYDCAFIAPPRFLESELINKNATACLKRVFRGELPVR